MSIDARPTRRVGALAWWGLAAVLVATSAAAQAPATRVTMDSGTPATTLSGEIDAGETRDYTLTAAAGQTLTVTLEPHSARSDGLGFTVMRIKGQSASFVGRSSAGGTWSGGVTADGEYIVRVATARTEKPQEEPARFKLTIALTQ